MYLHSKIALYQNKCEILYCCLPDLHSDQVIITINKSLAGFLIMFLPPFLIISLLTQLPYPYGNIKTLLWSENICKCGGRYTCLCFRMRQAIGFKHSDSIAHFPRAIFHSFASDPFFYPFHNNSVCCISLSLFLFQNSMSKLMFLKAHSRKMLLTSFSLYVFNHFHIMFSR